MITEIICTDEIPLQQRAMAASLLGKLVGQPMHGPRVAITLARFLPDGLVSVIRDGPGEAVVVALEQTTETPELVWTPAMAASLSAQISTMASELFREQMKGRVIDWDVPEQASGQQEMRDEPQVLAKICYIENQIFSYIEWIETVCVDAGRWNLCSAVSERS